ncbi:MAG: PorP/SprF family type IX secretion system membrane protein [Flavobacteriaceae bacterium]
MHTNKPQLILLLLLTLAFYGLRGQDENPYVVYDVPSQNLLKFNRFLINPTFSTVREDKSYVNLFHRNQSVSFNDNNQVYFLSYSGRIGDRSGVGASLFTNREGLFNNFGIHTNYAYGIRLSQKSNFTFGANFSYYQSAFNQNRANALDNDPLLNGLESSSLITFQPGFNISYGNFDFGAFAENLFDYNLKTSESVTEFNEKTYSGHLQYTYQFKNGAGLLEQGRLMPLARVRKVGEETISLGGNLLLDLPKLGWVQAGYDDFYGASAGLGFNLNKNLSVGYTVEKGLSSNFDNFGVSHEISLAYSFTPNLTEDRVMLEQDNEDLVETETVPEENLTLSEKDLRIAALETKLAENDAILDELLLRQDSIENARERDLERRFETVMKMVRRETRGQMPELEQKAKEVYFAKMDSADIITKKTTQPLANHGLSNTTAAKKRIRLNESKNQGTASRRVVKSDKTKRHYKRTNGRFKQFDIPNIESGHYLIANVFRSSNNANGFLEKLQEQGIDAGSFENPKNGLNYVYLKGFRDKKDAIAAYHSKLNGSYQEDAWVMNIHGVAPNNRFVAVKKVAGSKYGNNTLRKNVTENKNNPSQVSYATYKINGLGSGFYIIANVFENAKNANRFVKTLNEQGLNASYFINPENNFRYVYLKKHETWGNALTSYYSKLNDSYDDQMWIMRVKPNTNS